jgi:putative ABC transport system substrate-binding protein
VISVLALLIITLCRISIAEAQQPKKIPRVGHLRFIEVPVFDAAFRQGLKEPGYVEGQNIQVEYRFAGGSTDRVIK